MKEQLVKSKLKNDSRNSNRAIQILQMKKSIIKFQQLGTFDIEENENLTTRMLAEDFNINYSTYQKVGKSIKIGWMDHQSLRTSLTPTNLNTYDEHQSHEYVRIYINLKQTNSVPKESRHWRRFSLKTSKERRFAFRQVLRFYPKKYRKVHCKKYLSNNMV